MDKICGTCKFKGEIITTSNARIPYDEWADNIDPIKQSLSESFLCDRINMVDENTNKTPSAFVADGSGYFAALCVYDDFGCVKWEVK